MHLFKFHIEEQPKAQLVYISVNRGLADIAMVKIKPKESSTREYLTNYKMVKFDGYRSLPRVRQFALVFFLFFAFDRQSNTVKLNLNIIF